MTRFGSSGRALALAGSRPRARLLGSGVGAASTPLTALGGPFVMLGVGAGADECSATLPRPPPLAPSLHRALRTAAARARPCSLPESPRRANTRCAKRRRAVCIYARERRSCARRLYSILYGLYTRLCMLSCMKGVCMEN